MEKQTKVIIGIVILIIGISLINQFWEKLSPGNYPYAEVYEINASENNMIRAIKQFKLLIQNL